MTTATKHVSRKTTQSSEDEDSVAETLAERRALHNSVERTRREALNSKFTHLAQQLPSLSHIHRPSKSVIISQCLEMVVELRETKAENEALRQELHYLRLSLGSQQPISPRVNVRLLGNADGGPSERRAFESAVPGTSPGQYTCPENSSTSTNSPKDYRGSISLYTSTIPANQHQVQSSYRPRPSTNHHNVFAKPVMNPHWQKTEANGASRLQPPEVYHAEYGAMSMSEHASRLTSETSHSTNASEHIEGIPMEVPQYYPTEYGPGIELMMQQHRQQQQHNYNQQHFMQAEQYHLT